MSRCINGLMSHQLHVMYLETHSKQHHTELRHVGRLSAWERVHEETMTIRDISQISPQQSVNWQEQGSNTQAIRSFRANPFARNCVVMIYYMYIIILHVVCTI